MTVGVRDASVSDPSRMVAGGPDQPFGLEPTFPIRC